MILGKFKNDFDTDITLRPNTKEYFDLFNNYSRLRRGLYSELDARKLDGRLNEYAKRHKINLNAYYVEREVLRYIFSSIGFYWGRIITKKHSSSIGKVLAKISDFGLTILEKIRLAPKGSVKSWQKERAEIAGEFDDYKLMMTEMLKMTLLQTGGPKMMLVDILADKGFMNKNETNDIVINQSLLKVIINFSFRYQFLTALEASLLLQDLRGIDTDDQMAAFDSLGIVIDGLVEASFSNLAPFFGAMAGHLMMGAFAKGLSRGYGPFYKKVPGLRDLIPAPVPA